MRIAILLLLSFMISGYAGPSSKPKAHENYNVIIVLIDALRFDHLGCYGYPKDTSPHIDQLSEKSLIFENAVSQAVWTKPAVISLFSSNYVKDHGTMLYTADYTKPVESNVLPSSAVTLAEVLSEQGYKTKAISGNIFIKKGFGLEQGFDEYDFIKPDRQGTSLALDWIEKNRNTKFFLYIHYMAPHADYDPPAEHKAKFKSEYHGTLNFRGKHQEDLKSIAMSQEDIEELRARYDGEISYIDFEVGQLIVHLQRKDLLEKTILIVTADHGEALLENQMIGHGHFLNTVIQVPLVVFLPWDPRQQRITHVVELIDIAPSILAQLNIKAPSSFKGINVFDTEDKIGKKFGFSQYWEWVLLRTEDYIFKTNAKESHLYDLNADPFELKDISQDHIKQVEAFMSACQSFVDKEDKMEMDSRVIDPQTVERLKSLGYLQ